MDIEKEQQKLLSRVGYLPSEAAFYTGMRVRDILKLSADLRKVDCREEAQLLCQRLKLDTSRKVDELSFGNKKKVAIVCALQHKPELLILDEPTSGLDPLMQREFFQILHDIHFGRTNLKRQFQTLPILYYSRLQANTLLIFHCICQNAFSSLHPI